MKFQSVVMPYVSDEIDVILNDLKFNINKSLKRDVFNLFYQPKFKIISRSNMNWWIDILLQIKTPWVVNITNNNIKNSFILTKSILEAIEPLFKQLDTADEEKLDLIIDTINSCIDENIEELTESFGDITNEINNNDSNQLDYINNLNILNSIKTVKTELKLNYNHKRIDVIKKISRTTSDLKKNIDDFIKTTINSFYGIDKRYTKNILIDDFAFLDILNPELLINTLFINDLTVLNIEEKGRVDLYIDYSESMNLVDVDIYGVKIERFTVLSLLAIKLVKLGLIDKCFVFNTTIKQINPRIIPFIIPMNGTEALEACILKVKMENRKALIITDAQTFVNTYCKTVFILTIQNQFYINPVLEEYNVNKQLIFWKNGEFLTLGT